MTVYNLTFPHGLGDCVNFAHAVGCWLRRGYDVRIYCPHEGRLLFDAAGCRHVERKGWNIFADLVRYNEGDGNKLAHNLEHPHPLPRIGPASELWPEVLETKLTLAPWLSYRQKERVERFIGGKPFILLHTRGYSWPDKKDFTPELEAETQLALLQQTEAEIVLLDQRKVAVRLPHPRVRLAPTDTALPELWYLISRASVLIGCDSGPLHLARLTETPAIGCWFGLNPETYLLSRTKTTNLLQPSAREIVGAVLNTV